MSSLHHPADDAPQLAAEPDPRFTFDYRPLDHLDALAEGQREMTYWDLEPLARGPEPRPDWLVVDRGAVDTELGVLKTGKEADAVLLRRALPGEDGCVLVAKRYRSAEHRLFQRSAAYTEGRTVRNTRDARALRRATTHGREVAAAGWAATEWEWLQRCWNAGLPVPYPVQIDGSELLREQALLDGRPAPRLADTRPDASRLAAWFEEACAAMEGLARLGVAHGDLSAYNLLAADDGVVMIDLPQVVDLAANPSGTDFLKRDVGNVCAWFRRKGLVDLPATHEEELFTDLVVAAFG
ncbi:MAG: serine protein kinase RIO [Marmoricola sp.]